MQLFFVKFCISVIFAILVPKHGLDPSLSPVTAAKLGKQLCTARLLSVPCEPSGSPQTHQGPPRMALPPRWLLLTQLFPSTWICHSPRSSQLTPFCSWGWSVVLYNFMDLLIKYLFWVAAESSLSTRGLALANFLSVCKILEKREVYLYKEGNGLHRIWNVYLRDFTSPDLRVIG